MPSGVLTNRINLACLRLASGLVVFLAACQAGAPSPTLPTFMPSPSIPAAAVETPTATLSPSPAIPAADTPTTSPSAPPSAAPGVELCSPLQDIAWAELPGMISNPFHPPRAGSDDPHQAVDFAEIGAAGYAVAGRGVQAVLEGRIAGVIADRFPYGNAVLVESPLEGLPGEWLEGLSLPPPAPTLAVIPALTCPAGEPLAYDPEKRSLYLLFAHLEAPPALEPGQAVGCGQALGSVGMSGNALNPHLHLEVRVAPAGIRLESMAHYDTSAAPQEMANYCTWRVSGLFQRIDPMGLWRVDEEP